jgi:hypothetical protein
MKDIITVRFETGDEARAAAASLADSVDENDIFILFHNQLGALDSDRDAARTNGQGGEKDAVTLGAYTDSLAGTAGGLPGEGKGANKASHAQAGLMLAVRVANANNKQQIIDCLRQHVGQGH